MRCSLCVATCIFESNVQPVIHHLATKIKKRTAHYARDEYLKGQLQNSGRVDSFTHRENNKFYYVVSNKLGFSFVAFCVCSIESLLVSLWVLGRNV